MAVADVAASHYRSQQQLARRAAVVAQSVWDSLDLADLDGSWRTAGRFLLDQMVAAQLVAARAAPTYVTAAVTAQGLRPRPAAQINPAAFAGFASDGRSLASLLAQPVIAAKVRMSRGARLDQALSASRSQIVRIAATQVADTGRVAVVTATAAEQSVDGFTRHLTPPACERCEVLAGGWYRWDAGFARHPNCFPAGVVVSGPQSLAATRRWYEGELVVLSTAAGEQVALTGNHPVLTSRGWVPANLLHEGDDVVRSTRTQGAAAFVVPHHHEVPSLIEDVWRALSVGVLQRMPTTAEDFHGDGQRGKVDVVYADSALRDGPYAAGFQPVGETGLASRVMDTVLLGPQGVAELSDLGYSAHSHGSVGGGGLGLAFDRRHLCGADQSRFAHPASRHTGFSQPSSDHAPRDAVLPGQRVLTGAGFVGGSDFSHGQVEAPPRWDPPGLAFTVETSDGYASRGVDLLHRLAGQVHLDRLVEVRRVGWSGHVFSLTTAEGWHTANSLIVSNCDCVGIPSPRRDEPLVDQDAVDGVEPAGAADVGRDTPEQILRQADGRDEALRRLTDAGYLQ